MSSWMIVCFSDSNLSRGINYLAVELVQNCAEIVNWLEITQIVYKHGISENLTKQQP
jgi:hypothetical protein